MNHGKGSSPGRYTPIDNCSQCETLPNPLEGSGKIFITSPLKHTLEKLISILKDHGHPYATKDNEILYSELEIRDLVNLNEEIHEKLSHEELKDTKTLWKGSSSDLMLSDLTRMLSLETFLNRLDSKWLVDVLKNDRLHNVYQPIVSANDTSDIHGYECLLRARDKDGQVIEPDQLYSTACDSHLLFQLDRDARVTSIENLKNLPNDQRFFINFRASSIYDPEYCLRSTFQAIEENDIDPEKLIFEVVEAEAFEDRGFLAKIIDRYREENVSVALDDFGTDRNSHQLLETLQPDYLKLDRQLTHAVRQESRSLDWIKNLIETASRKDILTMAKNVEGESEYQWFRDNGVDFLQGNFFQQPTDSL